MTMVAILQEIISIISGGIVGLAESLGTGISALVKNMFFTLSEQGAILGLSEFGAVIAIFAGIALSIALARRIYILLASMGGRR